MKQIALQYFTDSHMTLLALVLFFSSFLFLIYRVYFYEKKEVFNLLSQLPLHDDEVNHVKRRK